MNFKIIAITLATALASLSTFASAPQNVNDVERYYCHKDDSAAGSIKRSGGFIFLLDNKLDVAIEFSGQYESTLAQLLANARFQTPITSSISYALANPNDPDQKTYPQANPLVFNIEQIKSQKPFAHKHSVGGGICEGCGPSGSSAGQVETETVICEMID